MSPRATAPALLAGLGVLLAACGNAPPAPAGPGPADPVADAHPEALFQHALALAQAGDLVRAEQYLAASIDRGYPEDRAMPVLIRVCVAASRLRIALGYAEPYLERHPDAWSLRYVVATIHLGMGDGVRARHELERVVQAAPEEPDPHFLLALVLRDEAGDPAGAEQHLRRYLELAPEGHHAAEARDALSRAGVPVPAPEDPESPGGEREEVHAAQEPQS